jgi:hypothetical protein
MCTLVETPDVTALLDGGVSLWRVSDDVKLCMEV